MSRNYLKLIIRLNGGIGLFSKSDDSLRSWGLFNDVGGIGPLQTVDEHRRKGYANIIVDAMCKELANQEKSSTLFVVRDNVNAEKLFISNGFEICLNIFWIAMKKLK